MARSGTAGAPSAQGADPADRQTSDRQTQPAARPDGPGGSSPDSQPGEGRMPSRRSQEPSSPPWRVEGMPDSKQGQEGGRPNWRRFWLILLALLLLNWLLVSALSSAVRPTVSYTFFWTQVTANNVQTITSTGDTIQGTFRHQVAYSSASGGSQQVQQFTTQRPTFANDNLLGKLQANGVTVNANPPSQGTPLWEELLLWFGPALLVGGLLAGGCARAGPAAWAGWAAWAWARPRPAGTNPGRPSGPPSPTWRASMTSRTR